MDFTVSIEIDAVYLNIQLDKDWESNFMKLENTFK